MSGVVYIDGQYTSHAEAKISVFDHGLLYGDGVFEGIRVYSGRIFKLRSHLVRLFQSARFIDLNVRRSLEEVDAIVRETVRRSGMAAKPRMTPRLGPTKRAKGWKTLRSVPSITPLTSKWPPCSCTTSS